MGTCAGHGLRRRRRGGRVGRDGRGGGGGGRRRGKTTTEFYLLTRGFPQTVLFSGSSCFVGIYYFPERKKETFFVRALPFLSTIVRTVTFLFFVCHLGGLSCVWPPPSHQRVEPRSCQQQQLSPRARFTPRTGTTARTRRLARLQQTQQQPPPP